MTRLGCQNRKCTYVNNRCIRSRNIRIITLTVDGLNECNCDAHKKKGALSYYITWWRQEVRSVWRPDPLEIRCGRESQHLAEGASGPPIRNLETRPVGEKMLDWGTCPREAGPQGPRLSSPGERERNAIMTNRVGVNILQFCLVYNSLLHTTLSNKMSGIFFYKTVSLLCCFYCVEYTTQTKPNKR